MKRREIAPGVWLMELDAEKFNRCRIVLHFRLPARRETATASAVLPLVLERGNAACPDMTALSRRLAELYGADLAVESTTLAANRILTVEVSGIKDKFALNGENLSAAYAELVFGTAFAPYLVNGVFDTQAVEIEREKLAQRLKDEINDKRVYCVRQARRKFFGGSPAGIERDGYLDEIDAVTPAALKAVYDELLAKSVIDVAVQGADAEAVETILKKYLGGIARCPAQPAAPLAMPRRETEHFEEKLDLVQAKLCMLFTSGTPTPPADLSAARLAMSLFGGSVTSRLFLNVREKQSLCYYCGSSCTTMAGVMMVDSGVEPANAQKAEQAILKELADLCSGPITEEEIEDCRRGLLSSLDSVDDNLSGAENWYYMQICRGEELVSPAQDRKRLLAVTDRDVRRILKTYSYSVGYLLTTGEAAHE